jgi:hypothetical protein
MYPHRNKPFTGLVAFDHSGVDAAPSQAAQVRHMGTQLRRGDEALLARAKAQGRKGFVETAAFRELGVPKPKPSSALLPHEESLARPMMGFKSFRAASKILAGI